MRVKRKLLKQERRRKTWKPRREKRENIIRTNDNGNNNHNKAKQYSVDNVTLYYTYSVTFPHSRSHQG